MAFPASTGTLSSALTRACQLMLNMRQQAVEARDRMAAGDVPSGLILDMEPTLRTYKTQLQEIGAKTGIGAYAQEQLGDGTLDVGVEFNAVIAEIDNTVTWIRNNFPQDANGFLLAQVFGATGRQDRTFTSAQTAGLRTQLDALIATVA